MCVRITAPFFVSTSPLSLECRGRDLVCWISSLFSSSATVWLMNSLPLSEWKPRIRNGNCASMTFQHRFQPRFGDMRRGANDLPLSDFVDGVDMVNALDSVPVALMHR